MRYGTPPIGERIKALQADGCDRILVIPLYPQYCAASTATVGDKVFETLRTMRWQPALAHRRALLRRSRLYRRARPLDAGRPRAARFRTRSRARVLSRHSASLFRQGRSLLLPLRQDDTAAAPSSRLGRGAPPHDVSVPLRPRRMAQTLHRRNRARARVRAASSAWPSSPRALPPTAWRRSRKSASKTPAISTTPAGERFAAIPCLNDSAEGVAVIEAVARRELKGWMG